jgi:predicted amidohydrolase YtcJ
MQKFVTRALVVATLALAPLGAAAQTADTILVKGKVVTVDQRFTITEALGVRAGRVVAVGSTAEIEKLKGPQTRVIDLDGRTVIPGLIDNHAHWVRAAEHDELRFDGVTSRAQALRMLAERVRASKPGEWIVVLGGWSEEQFTDNPRGFPLAELDRIAPSNPVAIQAVYNHTYLNSVGMTAAKIEATTADPVGAVCQAPVPFARSESAPSHISLQARRRSAHSYGEVGRGRVVRSRRSAHGLRASHEGDSSSCRLRQGHRW